MVNMQTVDTITAAILELRDDNGCWNVLDKNDKYFPDFNYYVPNYKSTLWTLVMLADIEAQSIRSKLPAPFKIMADHFLDKTYNIYTLGRTHFPIPCLNGNMLYLHEYFGFEDTTIVDSIIDFFAEYQRFDDGDFKTPSSFPYFSNRSCYGKHTCYWGVVKLFKGLSFIPIKRRSKNAKDLIRKCIDFILLHRVCYRSRETLAQNGAALIQKGIDRLSFPHMYKTDFLEVLWLLEREGIKSERMAPSLDLLKSKMKPDGTWELERPVQNLIYPLRKTNGGNDFITRRARQVLAGYPPAQVRTSPCNR